ncbi:MAG TPA: hypothetical protein VM029_03615, partial [Opitutaceae bacterium]|nr:hypothetical protein [Opitutaceae bacterium]
AAGTAYQIAIDGYGGATGTIVLRLALTASSGSTGGTGRSRLINVSTRGVVPSGGTLTPGFVVRGTGTKQLLIRGLGPALASFGVAGTMGDPRLELVPIGSTNPSISNDNWGTNNVTTLANAASAVGAFALQSGSRDAAVVTSLSLSAQLTGYTVRVSPVAGGTAGVALAEVYDMDPASSATRLVNISTLGFVGTGGNVMICGFVVSGNGPKQLLIRAVGEGLGRFGVGGLLADPTLAVFQGSAQIASNDDWVSTPALRAATTAAGAFALTEQSLDSALVLVLQPGTYTAQVIGFDNATGNALVEIYDLDP